MSVERNGGDLRVRIPTFRYNSAEVLRGIDLNLPGSGLVALLGPNGSGKSTLLKVVAGLLRGEETEISRAGRRLDRGSSKEVADQIAWVPQRADLPFAMTVREMVQVGRYRFQRPLRPLPGEAEDRIVGLLGSVGLDTYADRLVDTLSGGEWQRALIARALIQETPILLLDEPIASLDLRYQDEIYILLRDLTRRGRLVLVADHHLEVAASHADRIILLHRGAMVAQGVPAEVLNSATIEKVFGVVVEVFPDPVTGSPRISRGRREG